MERNQFLAQLRSRMPINSKKPAYIDDRVQRKLTPDACLQLFIERATAALSHVHVCESMNEAASVIDTIIGEESFVDTGCQRFVAVVQALTVTSQQALALDRSRVDGHLRYRFIPASRRNLAPTTAHYPNRCIRYC
jgi:hypothetical protein